MRKQYDCLELTGESKIMIRKQKSPRRIVTIKELAEYFRVHRSTMSKRVKEYGSLDFYDWRSVVAFVDWMRGIGK